MVLRRAGIVLVSSVVAILAGMPAYSSAAVPSDSEATKNASPDSSAVVFSYHGKSFTPGAMRQVATSNHCVPAARDNHFECFDTMPAALAAYRATGTLRPAPLEDPPPKITLINNNSGPYSSIILARWQTPDLTAFGWNDRADVVKMSGADQQMMMELHRKAQYLDHMMNMLNQTIDIANDQLSSMKGARR